MTFHDSEEAREHFLYDLLTYGKAVYDGVEYKITYDPDPRPRCKICQHLIQAHAPVILLKESNTVFRLCNGALVLEGHPVLSGEDETFFWKGGDGPTAS